MILSNKNLFIFFFICTFFSSFISYAQTNSKPDVCPDVDVLKVQKLLDQDKDKILLAKYEVANLKLLYAAIEKNDTKTFIEEIINEKNKKINVDDARQMTLAASNLFKDYLNGQSINDKINQLTAFNYNYYHPQKRLDNIQLAQLLMIHLNPNELTGAITEINAEDIAIIWTVGVVLEKRKLKKGQYDFNIANSSNQVARYLEIIAEGGDVTFSQNKIKNEIEKLENKLSGMIEKFNEAIQVLGENLPAGCKDGITSNDESAICSADKSTLSSEQNPSIYSLVSSFGNDVYKNLFVTSLMDNAVEDFVLYKKIIPAINKNNYSKQNKNRVSSEVAITSSEKNIIEGLDPEASIDIAKLIGNETKKMCVARYDGGLRNSTSINFLAIKGFAEKLEQLDKLTRKFSLGTDTETQSNVKKNSSGKWRVNASGSLIMGKGDIYKCCENEKILLDLYYAYGGLSVGLNGRVYMGVVGLLEGFIEGGFGFSGHLGGVNLQTCQKNQSIGCLSGFLYPSVKLGGGISGARGLGEVGVFGRVEGEGLLAYCPSLKVINLRGVITSFIMTTEISVGWGFFNHNHKFCPWCPEYSCGKCDKNQALWEDKWVFENI